MEVSAHIHSFFYRGFYRRERLADKPTAVHISLVRQTAFGYIDRFSVAGEFEEYFFQAPGIKLPAHVGDFFIGVSVRNQIYPAMKIIVQSDKIQILYNPV